MGWMRRFWLAALLGAVALVSLGAWGAVEVLGWRTHTAFLSGNAVSLDEAGQGAIYVLLWLQVLVVAPIAGLAAVGAGLWEWLSPAEAS